ncbi:alpha/beta hydrolase [Halomonas sp. QX-2]|jgi:predicted alpha/beta superfamily hydrolase|uniref:Alpha/beta hydrolase n=1 Tax=Vreelandella sedimenti TaxID=2729618 RepID=A0A7Z0SQA1_9GAMM|nr:alpha/beta hydrolase-fold protein [Halomonas sedimenti]NYT73314.1 alpha/beta hydrolase [Halomonas sedimenti]|tara:strand:+ start:1643 stop:2515 length:873 start_codon:yes stop_codon:yes gene_type:complete
MKLFVNNLVFAGLVLLAASVPKSQAQASPVMGERQVSLDQTLEWAMQNEQGAAYRILISKPEGEVPYSGGYPVIYVLDGNAYFASLHEAKRAQEQFRQAIIVGIAYPGEAPHNFLRRSYDLSPPVAEEQNTPPQGGQDELLDFIEHSLMPAIAERFPVDANHQSLYGHSFGGMFAIYALFTRPDLFNHIVAASPSLWWNNSYLLKHERDFRQQVEAEEANVIHHSLSLVVADNDSLQNQQDASQLYQRLEDLSAYGLRSSYHKVEGEDHMSVPFVLESRVLKQLLGTRGG